LARGFFSSINETVSITGFGAFGASGAVGVGGGSFAVIFPNGLRVGADGIGGLGGAGADSFGLAGASTFALFVSLCFASGAGDSTAVLTVLRAVVVFRAEVLLVVFAGI
jgi:hypothetical protein